MKKWELLKQAYDKYPKGTKFNALRTSDVKESNGAFDLIEQHDDIIIISKEGIIYEAGCWAKVVIDSILDGKVAIQVNNEREFKLLMEHMHSKGWRWIGKHPCIPISNTTIAQVSRLEYQTEVMYQDEFLFNIAKEQRSKWQIISFADFAAEIGIKVPVFILPSEDGFDLYEGDLHYIASYSSGGYWWYNCSQPLYKDHIVVTETDHNKAFTTKEAAEKWISEMNKPKSILIAEESSYPVEVFSHEIVVQCKTSHRHSDNIIISSSELESIYKAYQSLQ